MKQKSAKETEAQKPASNKRSAPDDVDETDELAVGKKSKGHETPTKAFKEKEENVEVKQDFEKESEAMDKDDGDDQNDGNLSLKKNGNKEHTEQLFDDLAEDIDESTDDERIKTKKVPKAKKPFQAKRGSIPQRIPLVKIIHATQLPRYCKIEDIVSAFEPYGVVTHVQFILTPPVKAANIAFREKKSAIAAADANNTIKIGESLIKVARYFYRKDEQTKEEENSFMKNYRERTVYVKNIKRHTTESQIKAHFASCGKIEHCKIVSKKTLAFAFITFTDKESANAAKKLHNTVLNDHTIGVQQSGTITGKRNDLDPKLAIILNNKQKLNSIDGKVLEKIFEKCGEIDKMDILCQRKILAFISFKNEEATKNALQMNGKTVENIQLEIREYTPNKKKTSIYVTNLPEDYTKGDLKKLFSQCGEIVNIELRRTSAVIYFSTPKAFCESFLLNESYIRNKMIFIEPNSERKQAYMKEIMKKRKNRKLKRVKNGFPVINVKDFHDSEVEEEREMVKKLEVAKEPEVAEKPEKQEVTEKPKTQEVTENPEKQEVKEKPESAEKLEVAEGV